MPKLREAASSDVKGSLMNPVQELAKDGQAPWLDFISQSLISTGQLKRHIDEDDLCGVNSDPAIFGKAITGPGRTYTIGIVEALQLRGDFDVLASRGRRALRVRLPSASKAALATLASIL